MVIQKLTGENFQGLRKFEFEFPGGCSGSIYGDNATGKTTVFNAVTWLLFGKASTGAKGFTPKTRGENGELHHLNHSVTGEFISDGGGKVTFTKTYHENWTKKRGNTEAELSGNVTDYAINGVPVNQKDYDAAILSYCGGDTEKPKILTMPDYFPEQMKWEDRRRILLEVCGDISDADVIASDKELNDLPEFLRIPGQTDQLYSIDEYRKIAAAERKKINSELELIPARIDEAKKAMPDLAGADQSEVDSEIKRISKEIDNLILQKADITNKDSAISQIRQQIAEKKAELAEARTKYQEEVTARVAKATAQSDAYWREVADAKRLVSETERELSDAKRDLQRLTIMRQEVLDEYKTTAAQKWDPNSETCPTCGQKLPTDRITQMRAHFNEEKSKKLELLNQRGKESCNKNMIAEQEQKVAGFEHDLEKLNESLSVRQKALDDFRSNQQKAEPFEETAQYKDLQEQIWKLMQSQTDAMSAERDATNGIDEAIGQKRQELSTAQEKKAMIGAQEAQKKRIAELESRQRELSDIFDKTEHGLYLSDLFIKTKVRMLTAQINSKFKTVSFQLFVDQYNGGIKEVCEVLVPGEGGRMVPYAYANNAARINAGLEIIGTLGDHWHIHLPVFIDNCEAVSRPLKIDTQEIRLYVSESDKTLRLELDQ